MMSVTTLDLLLVYLTGIITGPLVVWVAKLIYIKIIRRNEPDSYEINLAEWDQTRYMHRKIYGTWPKTRPAIKGEPK